MPGASQSGAPVDASFSIDAKAPAAAKQQLLASHLTEALARLYNFETCQGG